MKKILLLGDSIRLGYENYVKERLSPFANVYSPKENCAFSQYLLRWINVWKEQDGYPDDIDLIHWNVGAWDVLRILDDGVFTSPEYYGETLRRIERRLRVLFPKAKQIFALGTSVQEEFYTPPYERRNSDIEEFNAIAIKTLTPLGVSINDLYKVSKTADDSCRSDMTHFSTPNGVRLLGDKVVACICDNIGVSISQTKIVQATSAQIDEKILGN